MNTSNYLYHHGEQELHGFLAYNDKNKDPQPAVLVVHDWSGRNEFACKKATMLAKMGYIGFAVDMYGLGRVAKYNDEKAALMQPLMGDRRLLRERMVAALDAVVSMSEVDQERIAVIGFCFGGLCALDLARSGADIKGAVSFHGILHAPDDLPSEHILAKILALHGYDDPMVPPASLEAFCNEMTKAKVDWQVHQYGLTQHAFTNPDANDEKLGTIYNSLSEKRSMQAMTNFLQEIFNG